MPGTHRIAEMAVAASVVPGRATVRSARLCNRDWMVVHELAEVPQGARFLSWRGRVFQHWAGTAWREIHLVEVE